jgi:SAM-dependent methyltransferase
MAGIGLDGHQILFVRYRGRKPAAAVAAERPRPQMSFFPDAVSGDFEVVGPRPVTTESIETFLLYLHSLARLPLTPEALADTFGPRGDIAQHVVGTLYAKLHKTDNRRVQTFFAEWQRIFGIVYGQDIGKAEADARALGKQFGVKTVPKLKEFLFCVHTYFALLMKLLAAEVMTLQRGAMMQSFIAPLASASSEGFRKALKDLEDGGLFARQGINNFLEGDFFSWYLSVWDKSLADESRALLRALTRFDPRTPYFAPEQTRDLLKKLYQYLVPKKLRHDLGEFYTPDWLAEHLLNQLEYTGDLEKRVLDPACGSGTFLVLATRRMKEWALDHDPQIDSEIVARRILENLCGFDLNPIAVIAARTNFLLAMGELVRYVRPIEIPIYMCDSVLTPSEYAELFGKGYRIPTAAGEFEIPGEIIQSNQMEKLAGLLEQCARGDYTPREFLSRAKRELAITHQATFDALEHLYTAIHKLEKQNRNGIWARWLKNAFAPLFKGKFDFVAGNPPWINWESLADEYRQASGPLWVKHGLVAKAGGNQFELGKVKQDFATLFVYSAMESYLEPGGKLGFLITQTTFKTKSAERFRRLRLGSGVPLHVIVAEDLVEIQPFEGASNWTGLIVLQRDHATTYPIKYVLWRKKEGGALQTDLPLEDVLRAVNRYELSGTPVQSADKTSPWLSLPAHAHTALEKVLGKSPYTARAGLVTWADGIYWVRIMEKRPDGLFVVENLYDAGKKDIQPTRNSIEPNYLYPFVRWDDIARWHAKPSCYILLPHTPQTGWRAVEPSVLKEAAPQTYAYLKSFEKVLLKRSGYKQLREGQPFYICSNTGPWLFARYKVAWKTMSPPISSSVLAPGADSLLREKSPLFKNTVVFVPIDDETEAHYLSASINSCCADLVARSYSVGKSFGSPHLLHQVKIPQFHKSHSTHLRLAELSRHAHELAAKLAEHPDDADLKRKLADVEDEVDRAAAQLWSLTDAELNEIRNALELLR